MSLESRNLVITGTVSPSASIGSSLVSTATLTSDLVEANLANNTAIFTTTVRGADLAVTKTGPAEVTAGFPATYTLEIRNSGLLTATNVVITDSLPVGLTFAWQESGGLTFDSYGQVLVWQAGALEKDEALAITLVATADVALAEGTVLTNVVTATTESAELEMTNNMASVARSVQRPAPQLALSPATPVVSVTPGQTQTLTLTVKNTGLAVMTGTLVTPPGVMPWASITPLNPPDLAPGQQTPITLTVAPGGGALPGAYRDFVAVSEASGGEQRAILQVNVLPATRSLRLTVTNDQGQPVPGTWVGLLQEDALVDVTPAFTHYLDVTAEGSTGPDGVVALPGLPVGTYALTIQAANHQDLYGSLTVVGGSGTQLVNRTLTAQAQLAVAPGSALLSVAAGQTAAQEFTIRNQGAAPLSGLVITPSLAVSWAYLATPTGLTATLEPGESLNFTLLASPPITQADWIYSDNSILVSAEGGHQAQVSPLTIQVTGQLTGELEVEVADAGGQPLVDAAVTLVRQAVITEMTGSGVITYHQRFSGRTAAGSGVASFSGLPVGGYNYSVSQPGYKIAGGVLQVAPSGSSLAIALDEDPFLYSWEVVRTTESYTIQLTITWNNDAEGLSLVAPTRDWTFATCDTDTLHDNILLLNPSDSAITLTGVTVSVPGVDVTVDSYPDQLAPNGQGTISVTGTKMADALGQGSIAIQGVYRGIDGDLVAYTLNPSSFTEPGVPLGQTFVKEYVLTPTLFVTGTVYSVTVTQPDALEPWITVSAPPQVTGGDDPLAGSGQATVTVEVTPPAWLQDGHTYAYTSTITLTDAQGNHRDGTLHLEATRAGGSVELHTFFSLGEIPMVELPLSGSGVINARVAACGGGGGDPSTGGSGGGWTWTPLPGGGGFVGTQPGGAGGGGASANPVTGATGTPGEITGDESQEVRLALDQRLMLEGESFRASLVLTSMAQQDVTGITVDLVISDTTGADASDLFTIVPAPPTGLGTLAPGEEVAGEWLIVPRVAVTDSGGRDFFVQAVVDYTFNDARRFTTLPERITVFPAPELEIDYQLPEAGLVCTVFDLKATVRNVGAGAARGLRLTSGQPRILDSSGGAPQSFEIVGVWANGQPVENAAMEVALGDPSTGSGQALAPGESGEVVWRIRAAQPGQFTAFTSDYRMLNYQGLALAPSLRAINTTFARPDDLAFYGCNANPGPHSIFGYVVNEDDEPIQGAIVSSGTGITATTNISGSYVLTNLGPGSYVLGLANIGPNLSPIFALPPLSPPLRPPCDEENDPGCWEAWREHLSSKTWVSPTTAEIPDSPEAQQVAANDNIEVSFQPIPDPPATGFKGAGWLSFNDDSPATAYQDNKVGWNLEQAKDLGAAYKDENQIVKEEGGVNGLGEEIVKFRDLETVYTIIRLDTPPPPDPVPVEQRDENDPQSYNPPFFDNHNVDKSCDDEDIQAWMDNLDREYDIVMGHINIENEDPSPIPIFVLGNEPNHPQDEWNYSGAEYAHLFNCYYRRWKGLEGERPAKEEALYAAGGGQRGPCHLEVEWEDETRQIPRFHPPDRYGGGVIYRTEGRRRIPISGTCASSDPPYDNGEVHGFVRFFEQMLIDDPADPNDEIIQQADGFAIHAYDYSQNDPNGDFFRLWLDSAVNTIRTWQSNHGLEQVPIIVTEYNPGLQNNGEANLLPEGWTWRQWFDTTYCLVQDYNAEGAVHGLLYFVDQPNANRRAGSGWAGISLSEHDERRGAWLEHNPTCETMQGGLQAPLPRSIILQAGNTSTIGGVISGTVGRPGFGDVYSVTADLEVPANQVLAIAPGTSLIFDPGRSMSIAGQLIAEGNSAYPIRFFSMDEAGWSGLHFQPSAQGSRCLGCYIENIERGGVAVQIEAPIVLQRSSIRYVPGGTAISSTIPFSLSNVWIDFVGTGLHVSGATTATHRATHLTLTRCEQGVVNRAQTLHLDNSIVTSCGVGASTELSGTTAISYSLLYANAYDFATESGAQLIQGSGILTDVAPGFVDMPNNVHLLANSPAVNAADPLADYSNEPGYNGGQADLGVYGNTPHAPEQPPRDQLEVSLIPVEPVSLTGRPGQTITYELTVKNTGNLTDSYRVTVYGKENRIPYFYTTLYPTGYDAPLHVANLSPQEEVPITVWVAIPPIVRHGISETVTVAVVGKYGVYDTFDLTTSVMAFQEAGGQVVMEAEHFAWSVDRSGRSWITQTLLAGYTGSGYMAGLPDVDLQFTTAYTMTSPELRYTINFTTTGVYTIWLRGYAPNAAGDSLYVAIDDQSAVILTGFTPRAWGWANRSVQSQAITLNVNEPGLHTLKLWQREDGLRADRIILTTNSEYSPDEIGPPESEFR